MGRLPGKNMINKAKVCNADLSHCLFHDLPPMKGLKCCLPGFTFVLPSREGRRNIFVNVCLDFRQIGEVRELYLCLLRLNSLWLKIILMLKWYIWGLHALNSYSYILEWHILLPCTIHSNARNYF